MKCRTIKLEDNIGENLDDLGYGDAFLDETPKTWSIKEIIDKLDIIKIKNFSKKGTVERVRRQAQIERRYLQKTQLIKDS